LRLSTKLALVNLLKFLGQLLQRISLFPPIWKLRLAFVKPWK